MSDLTALIEKWENSALELREAEQLINLLIVQREIVQEQWEPEAGNWYIVSTGEVHKLVHGSNVENFGTVRKTKMTAEKSANKMRIHNRLLAYVDEHAPDYEPDWNDRKNDKYFVYYDYKLRSYCMSSTNRNIVAGCVYMPERVAYKLADDLNSGRVVL